MLQFVLESGVPNQRPVAKSEIANYALRNHSGGVSLMAIGAGQSCLRSGLE